MSAVARSRHTTSQEARAASSNAPDRGPGAEMRLALLPGADNTSDGSKLDDVPGGGVGVATAGVDAASPSSSGAASPSADRLPASVWYLCLCAFLMSLKPSEPFLTNYLIDVVGLSDDQVNEDVYPVWTYAYLACMLPCGVLAHATSARVVVLLGLGARLATRFLLLFGSTVFDMQLMQVAFGLASACEPIMYALVYQRVPRRFFTACTSWMQAAALCGHLIAGLSGQAMVSAGVELRVLFIISAVSVGMATLLFVATSMRDTPAHPPPAESFATESSMSSVASPQEGIELRRAALTAERSVSTADEEEDVEESWVAIVRTRGWKALFATLAQSYAHPSVRLWSLWWCSSLGVLELVLNYNTTLFYERAPEMDHDGLVVALGRGAAAIAAMVPTWTSWDAQVEGATASGLLVGLDLFSAGLLFLSGILTSVYAAYALFVVFYSAMQYLTAISSSVVAAHLPNQSRRTLVWTMNSFVSLVLQTVTQTVLGHHVLHAKGPSKFLVLAAQLAAVALGFAVWEVVRRVRRRQPDATGKGYQRQNQYDGEETPIGAAATDRLSP